MLADMVRTLPTREAYDLRSEVYDRDGNPPIAPEERHIDALIGDVAGASVADVGCGYLGWPMRFLMKLWREEKGATWRSGRPC